MGSRVRPRRGDVCHSRGARAFSIGELDKVLMLAFRLHVDQTSVKRRFPLFNVWFIAKNTG